MVRLRTAAAIAAIVASPSVARAGGACGARTDCLAGERCVNNFCVSEAEYTTADKNEKTDKSTFGFAGVAVGGVLPVVWSNVGTGAQLALRIGAVVDGLYQFQLEVAPASTVMTGLASSPIGVADVTGSIGLLIPVSDIVSWVVRVGGGGGGAFGNNVFNGPAASLGFGEFRFDVAGVSIRTSKHVMVECNAPSVRLLFPTSSDAYPLSGVGVMFVTNVTVSYVF